MTLPHHSIFPWWKGSVKNNNNNKRKNPVGEPNDPKEGPVTEQKELMFVLVTVGIPHLCAVLSLLLLVCIMYSLLQLSLIIPAKRTMLHHQMRMRLLYPSKLSSPILDRSLSFRRLLFFHNKRWIATVGCRETFAVLTFCSNENNLTFYLESFACAVTGLCMYLNMSCFAVPFYQIVLSAACF